MSLVRHFFRKIFLSTGIFLTVGLFAGLLTGCQQANSGLTSALMTPQGLRPEAFLPQETFLLFAFGPTNQQQHDAFANLLARFPVQDQQDFGVKLIAGFNKDLVNYGMDYQKDIVPALGQNLRILVGLAGTPVTTQGKPDIYALVPLLDTSKMDGIFQKLVQNHFFTQESYNSHTIFVKSSNDEYMTRVGDLLLVTNGDDIIKSALDRQRSAQASLLDNQIYQRALHELKPSIAFVYINVQQILTVLRQDTASRTKVEQVFGQLPGGDFLAALQGEMLFATAEDKGLRLYGSVYGDEEKMKAMPQNFLSFPSHEPYLYKRVPGSSVLAYVEGYNLEKILNIDFQAWSNVEGFTDGLKQLKQTFAQAGLDFDKDFMPLLEEGVVLNVQNNGTIVPSVSFYADVENHLTEANKVGSVLKMIVDVLIKDIEAKSPETAGLLTNEPGNLPGGTSYVVRLHLNKLNSQNKNLALLELFLTKPLELWYGVTGDKVAFVAFDSGFDQNYQSAPKVQDDQNFKNLLDQLGNLKSGITYVSPLTFAAYLDKIVGIAQMAPKSLPSGTQQVSGTQQASGTQQDSGAQQNSLGDYQKVRSYLKPFGGAAFTIESVSAGEAHLEGFLQIQ